PDGLADLLLQPSAPPRHFEVDQQAGGRASVQEASSGERLPARPEPGPVLISHGRLYGPLMRASHSNGSIARKLQPRRRSSVSGMDGRHPPRSGSDTSPARVRQALGREMKV